MPNNSPVNTRLFPVVLMLHMTTPRGGQEHLTRTLKQAVPYYKQPGGIRVRLLNSIDQPDDYIEMIEYETEEGYLRDQQRVSRDAKMRELIDQWHLALSGQVSAKPYFDLSSIIQSE